MAPMPVIQYINLTLEIWGCLLTAVVVGCLHLDRRKKSLSDRMYHHSLMFNAGTMLFDVLATLLRGHLDFWSIAGVRVFNFLMYTCNFLLLAAFASYLTEYLSHRVNVSRRPLYAVRILGAVGFAGLILTQFCPFYYYIDAQNIYHRGPYFWLSQVIAIFGMIICSQILIYRRRSLERNEAVAFWSYIVLPIIALIVQCLFYGLVLLSIVTTLALTVAFFLLQAEQGRRLAEQEQRLTQDRVTIMLSQIQPHFLYNALNSIYYLCGKDPPAAQKAIDDFATYLRGNLDSLKQSTPVPFEQELSHVRIYLSLEKMRFDDELNIVYDIRTAAFAIPTLTVQPLVENAVKYGVGKKPGGGTVSVSSQETADGFEVVVQDDGVGYDPDNVQSDGRRTHIGISNVRSRLMEMSRATLDIQSTPGKGTTAVIRLPKEAAR
jgi:two-component system LytT family sensor kinase